MPRTIICTTGASIAGSPIKDASVKLPHKDLQLLAATLIHTASIAKNASFPF